MHAAPASCQCEGDSSSRIAANSDRAERLKGEHHGAERGRQARERDRDQQPAEDLRAEREHDQPAGGAEGRQQVEVAGDRTPDAAADRRRQRGVEERTGRSAQVTAGLAQREQEPRVRHAGQDPEDRPEGRVRTVRALLEHAGDEDDTDADDRDRRERGTRRTLAEHGPREHRDEHDLRVPEHGREPRPDLLDRVVPEDQVCCEEHSRRPRDQPRSTRARPVAPVLEPGDQPERRQRPETAEERTGARRHLRVAIEDRRERDRERTREHERDRSPAERRRRHAVFLSRNEKAGRHIARSFAS